MFYTYIYSCKFLLQELLKWCKTPPWSKTVFAVAPRDVTQQRQMGEVDEVAKVRNMSNQANLADPLNTSGDETGIFQDN